MEHDKRRVFFEPIVYAARIKNKEELIRSSSGGVFTAISDVLIENKGGCAACQYSYDKQQVEFVILTDKEKRNKTRGSKYIHTMMGDIFN